jgi:N-acetylglucosaminyldiphosphoundecaprenol N-acetyl-beta-D-mannosaminyltransferase
MPSVRASRHSRVHAPPAREPRAGHVTVGPLSVLNGDLATAADLCLAAIVSGAGARIATANLDFVAKARSNTEFARDLADSSTVVADGAPVAWLARMAGARNTRRVTGVDLVGAIMARAEALPALRVVLYGSRPEIAGRAARDFEAKYPGVTVAAVICPPFGRTQTVADFEADLQTIRGGQPHLVLVALGCPRQERFIAQHSSVAPRAVWIGVGGTLDFYAGERKRAPGLMRVTGTEWLMRLVQEPRRLWRRYLVDDLPALAAVTPGVLNRRLRGLHALSPRDVHQLRRDITIRASASKAETFTVTESIATRAHNPSVTGR